MKLRATPIPEAEHDEVIRLFYTAPKLAGVIATRGRLADKILEAIANGAGLALCVTLPSGPELSLVLINPPRVAAPYFQVDRIANVWLGPRPMTDHSPQGDEAPSVELDREQLTATECELIDEVMAALAKIAVAIINYTSISSEIFEASAKGRALHVYVELVPEPSIILYINNKEGDAATEVGRIIPQFGYWALPLFTEGEL